MHKYTMLHFKNWLLLIGSCLLIFACESDPTSNWKPLNLLEHGVSMTILAPDSAEVKTSDMIVQKDITVKKGDDYAIQIYASDATTTDVSKVLAEQKAIVKELSFFSKIVKEEPNSFIYEMVLDSAKTNYDFRYVRIKGDKEFIFQTGYLGDFSLENVEQLLESVMYESKK